MKWKFPNGVEMTLDDYMKDEKSPSQAKLKRQINMGEREGGGKDDAAPMARRQHKALDEKRRVGVEKPSKQMSSDEKLRRFKKGSAK